MRPSALASFQKRRLPIRTGPGPHIFRSEEASRDHSGNSVR